MLKIHLYRLAKFLSTPSVQTFEVHDCDIINDEKGLLVISKLLNRNNWFPFCSVTNVMWLIYLVRYLYDSMEEKNIGSRSERKDFIYHFKDLHHYGQ